MSQFKIDKDVLQYFELQKMPCGYIVLCSSNPLDKKPAYWCSVYLRKHGLSTRFCAIIDGINSTRKRYDISIYRDTDFLDCVLALTIHYLDDNVNAIDWHTIEKYTDFIPEEVPKLLHYIVYSCTLMLPIIYAREPESDPCKYMEAGYCLHFKEGFSTLFEEKTQVPLENVISVLNLLL